MTKEDGEKFLYDVCSTIRLFNQGAFYISFYRLGIDWMMNAITRSGMKWRNLIIWKKNNHNLSNSDYKSLYEPIIVGYADDYVPILYGWSIEHNYFGKKNEKDIWEITESSVWEIDKTKINDLHPTMKPIKLMERAIKNSSKQLGSVLDLFGGSGSTMVACHQLNRKCYMSELDPKYVQTIVNRMIKLDPTLEIKRNGQPYITTQ